MEARYIHEAAHYFLEARSTGRLLEALPPHCRPANGGDALAIQMETIAHLDDKVAGWKTGVLTDGVLLRGSILASRSYKSPARVPARLVPLLGVEGEIAFRFVKPLPPRAKEYTREEVEDAMAAFVAIEIVDSRFANYKDAPALDKAADCVSNGGFVAGTDIPNWKSLNLVTPDVKLTFDGAVAYEGNKGHPRKDPAGPAVELANELRKSTGVAMGQFMTTGAYTGLQMAKPGQTAVVEFKGIGTCEVKFA